MSTVEQPQKPIDYRKIFSDYAKRAYTRMSSSRYQFEQNGVGNKATVERNERHDANVNTQYLEFKAICRDAFQSVQPYEDALNALRRIWPDDEVVGRLEKEVNDLIWIANQRIVGNFYRLFAKAISTDYSRGFGTLDQLEKEGVRVDVILSHLPGEMAQLYRLNKQVNANLQGWNGVNGHALPVQQVSEIKRETTPA